MVRLPILRLCSTLNGLKAHMDPKTQQITRCNMSKKKPKMLRAIPNFNFGQNCDINTFITFLNYFLLGAPQKCSQGAGNKILSKTSSNCDSCVKITKNRIPKYSPSRQKWSKSPIFFLPDSRYVSIFVSTRQDHYGGNIPHRHGHLL